MLLTHGRVQRPCLAQACAKLAGVTPLRVMASMTAGSTSAAAVRRAPVRRRKAADTQSTDAAQERVSSSGRAAGRQGNKAPHKQESDLAEDRQVNRQPRFEQVALNLKVGDFVDGVVTSVLPYGAFVDVGEARKALLHISQISHERLSSPEQVFKVGDKVRALVLNVNHSKGRIYLSTKKLEKEPGDILRMSHEAWLEQAEEQAAAFRLAAAGKKAASRAAAADTQDNDAHEQDEESAKAERRARFERVAANLEVGDLVDGVVTSVKVYAAFVDLPGGFRSRLHMSDLSLLPAAERPVDMRGTFRAGDKVKALVLKVDRGGCIILSIKRLEKEPGDFFRMSREAWFEQAEEQAAAYRQRLAAGKEATSRAAAADAEDDDAHSQNQDNAPAECEQGMFKVGQLVDGVVSRVDYTSAFVDVGKKGVISRLCRSKISFADEPNADEVFQVGDKIKALVVHIDCKGRRLSLSTQHLEKEPGDMLKHGMTYVSDSAEEQAAAYTERLEASKKKAAARWAAAGTEDNDAHEQDNQLGEAERQAHFDWVASNLTHFDLVVGVVKSVQPYGAIVDIGEGVTALLHISAISSARVNNVKDVFKVGDKIRAMVRHVDYEKHRISLSTKKLEKEPGDIMRLNREAFFGQAEQQAAAFWHRITRRR